MPIDSNKTSPIAKLFIVVILLFNKKLSPIDFMLESVNGFKHIDIFEFVLNKLLGTDSIATFENKLVISINLLHPSISLFTVNNPGTPKSENLNLLILLLYKNPIGKFVILLFLNIFNTLFNFGTLFKKFSGISNKL